METKICTKCGQELPATTEYFYKNGNHLRSHCKKCITIRCKEYYQKNKEDIITRVIKYQKNNEKVKKYQESYRLKHREKAKQTTKEWYKNNTERAKNTIKNCIFKRKEYYQKKAKEYVDKNRIRIKQVKKEWREKNKSKCKKYSEKSDRDKILNLKPSYIAGICKMSTKELTPELLEQKRLTILIKRELCK